MENVKFLPHQVITRLEKMDEKDKQIIKILKDDGRAGYGDIGSKIGLSEGAVRKRIKTLTDEGVIRKFTVKIGVAEGAQANYLGSFKGVSTPEFRAASAQFIASLPFRELRSAVYRWEPKRDAKNTRNGLPFPAKLKTAIPDGGRDTRRPDQRYRSRSGHIRLRPAHPACAS